MPKPHRIAIVGLGAIAGMHARAIRDIPEASLVGGCTRNAEKAAKWSKEQGCPVFATVEELMEKARPDVLTICTPSGAHLEPTLAALERGVHVLCEKPLEITTARIDQMLAAAAKSKAALGGIFPMRFIPVVQAVRAAVASGRLGAIATISTAVPWWRDDAYYAPTRWQGKLKYDGGGALMNQSIHGIDALQWIAGSAMPGLGAGVNPVEQVFAFTAKRGHDPNLIEVEDAAVAVLRFRDGSLGQILGATSMFPGTLRRLRVGGRDGTAEVLEEELVTYRFRQELPEDAATRQRFAAKTKSGGGAGDPMAIDYTGHTRNITAFLEAIDAGKTPEIDGLEARKAVAIIEAIYESARTGQATSPR